MTIGAGNFRRIRSVQMGMGNLLVLVYVGIMVLKVFVLVAKYFETSNILQEIWLIYELLQMTMSFAHSLPTAHTPGL